MVFRATEQSLLSQTTRYCDASNYKGRFDWQARSRSSAIGWGHGFFKHALANRSKQSYCLARKFFFSFFFFFLPLYISFFFLFFLFFLFLFLVLFSIHQYLLQETCTITIDADVTSRCMKFSILHLDPFVPVKRFVTCRDVERRVHVFTRGKYMHLSVG